MKLDLIAGLVAGIVGTISIYLFDSGFSISSICFVSIVMTIFSITRILIKNRA